MKLIFVTLQPFNRKSTAAVNRLESLAIGVSPFYKKVEIWGMFPSKDLEYITHNYHFINLCGLTDKGKVHTISKAFGFILSCFVLSFRLLFLVRKSDVVINYLNSFLIVDLLIILFSKIRNFKVALELTEHPSIYFRSPLVLTIFTKVIVRGYSCCFVISKKLKSFLLSKLPSMKVEVVGMTVNLERFNLDNSKDSRPKYIGYCGSLSQQKDGLEFLLKAFAEITEEYPPLKLKIAGKGNSFEMRILEDLATDLGINNRVEFVGYLDADEVISFLEGSSLLVLARPRSLQAEYGFPTKVGEYLASGIPVILTSTGDIPELIQDEYHALLIEPNNHFALTNAMRRVLSNPTAFTEMGRNGRNIAEDLFNCKVQGQKLANFLLQLR